MIYVADWEGDGDQDLLVGDIEGKIHVVRNGSGDKTFKVEKVDRISAAGTPISAPGRNSGPVVSDWDGDGKLDLLVGCGDGSVQFFKNTAEKGEPVLAGGQALIDKSSTWMQGETKSTNPCGSRAKLAVADWNGDGKTDLLVGDYSSVTGKMPDLTEEQKKRNEELQAELKTLQASMQEYGKIFAPLYEEWYGKAFKELGIEFEGSWRDAYAKLDNETRQKVFPLLRKYQAEHPKWAEYDKLMKRNSAIWQELRKFQAPRSNHGFVWLFLRK